MDERDVSYHSLRISYAVRKKARKWALMPAYM